MEKSSPRRSMVPATTIGAPPPVYWKQNGGFDRSLFRLRVGNAALCPKVGISSGTMVYKRRLVVRRAADAAHRTWNASWNPDKPPGGLWYTTWRSTTKDANDDNPDQFLAAGAPTHGGRRRQLKFLHGTWRPPPCGQGPRRQGQQWGISYTPQVGGRAQAAARQQQQGGGGAAGRCGADSAATCARA